MTLRTLKARINGSGSRLQVVGQVKRITGHRLQERRARKYQEAPLCRPCLERGITRVWVHLDHIIPLHQGGADIYENTEGLCLEHHDAKTADEAKTRGGG